jgi:redox-sensitive bicupin YhaK (pirin superfamily)
MAKSIEVTADRSRHFGHWTRGKLHVAITRSGSPSDSAENLQPFAFLDYFDTKGSSFSDFGLRDRSNFATLTHLMEGDVRYETQMELREELDRPSKSLHSPRRRMPTDD